MRPVIAGVLALALSGCAVARVAQYDFLPTTDFADQSGTWLIIDKPGEGRFLIRPTLGRLYGATLVDGATLGLANAQTGSAYNAAAAWLKTRGTCSIVREAPIMERWTEFYYSCQQ